MKQKYSLSIADVELNVSVDESPEIVEYIVGAVDRKMRDVLLKSKYCPKTSAALLCALDFCADKVKAKGEIEKLNDELESLQDLLKASEDKYTRAQALTVNLEKEKTRLEIENGKLRAVLAQIKKTGIIPEENIESMVVAKEEANTPVSLDAVPVNNEKPQDRSRVGSMFELLTFEEI